MLSRYLAKVRSSNLWLFKKNNLKIVSNLTTRSSAVAERPRDASCHWIFC